MELRAIGNQSTLDIKPVEYNRNAPLTKTTSVDDVRTSKRFMMLSENLPTLREQLKPRESVVKQHAQTIDKLPNLSDEEIDRLVKQL